MKILKHEYPLMLINNIVYKLFRSIDYGKQFEVE